MITTKKEFHYALANNFNMFVQKVFSTLNPRKPYNDTIATKLICDRLIRAQKGEYQNLLINISPRSLKSTIISVAFPAWLLGKDPSAKIMCISYNDELVKEFSTACRKILESDWYQATFPKTKLNPNKKTEAKFETTQNGYRIAISIQGAMTGRGGEWIIIDDPQKPDDVLSDVIRNRVNKIFGNTILSRLNNKCEDKIIVVGQRLHVDDFYSQVQKFSTWNHLVIPAIAQKDEKFELLSGDIITRTKNSVINPRIESLEKLQELEAGVGNYDFAAQYLQNPIPAEGNIISYSDFIFYDTLPSTQDIKYFQSWDVAAKTGEKNDYSVCVTAAICDNIAYVLDISRYKIDFTDLVAEVKAMQQKYSAKLVIIEDIGIGTSLINYLRKEGLFIIPHMPKLSKADRAVSKTYIVRSGNVRLPQNADWLADFRDEIQSFPYGKHDDQVDAFVQLLDEFEKGYNSCNSIEDVAEAINKYKEENPPQTSALQLCQQARNFYKRNSWRKSPF